MKATVKKVTPAQAKAWLKGQDNIRNPNRDKVNAMVLDMRNGHWENNGHSLKFQGTGSRATLVDGQNRLHAVILAGKPVDFVVVEGIDGSRYVDLGEKRTLQQLLRAEGTEYASRAASVAGAMASYHEWSAGVRSPRVSHTARIDAYKRHKKGVLQWSPELAHYAYSHGLRWNTQIQLCLVLGTQPKTYTNAKEEFLYFTATGEGLPQGDPCLALRHEMAMQKGRSMRYSTRHATALVIKAWNACRAGMSVERLTFKDTGPTAEDFPKIQ